MFLHGGNNKNIRKKEIIGIFDMDTATVSPITKRYLSKMEEDKKLEIISYELPKSFILTEKEDQQHVYVSPISTQTLVSRANESLQKKNLELREK